jgi:hypothetical protein
MSVGLDRNPLEHPGYFEVPGGHLYTVLHEVPDPLARVLLVGPFTSERHVSYIPWVRWARYLAARGIECLRYDYRGIGESTGAFGDFGFENWLEDVRLLGAWLKHRAPDTPLILHGMELGAILAAKNFQGGMGDGMLLWSPPSDAHAPFRTALLRRIGVDHAFKFKDDRRPMSAYIQDLENGRQLDVDGYQWSAKLWRDSFRFDLPAGFDDPASQIWAHDKPVRIVKLDARAAPLVKGSSVGYETINRDLNWLFAENFNWIADASRSLARRQP